MYAFFVTYANAERVRPGVAGAAVGRAARRSTAGCCRGSRARSRSRATDSRPTTRPAPGRRIQALRRRPVELVRAARRGAGSGTPAARAADDSGRLPHAVRVPRHGRHAARPVHAVRRRGAVAQPRGRTGTAAPTPSTWPTTPRPTPAPRDEEPRGGDGRRARRRVAGPHDPRRTPRSEGPPTAAPRPSSTTPATTPPSRPLLDLVAEELNVQRVGVRRVRRPARPVAGEAELQGARARGWAPA